MTTINDVIEEVLSREGGYVNDPRDAGGETNFGITIATARSAGYSGPMRSLPRDLAKTIYRQRYVAAPGFDAISDLSTEVAAEMVDCGVNMGPSVAIKFLQRTLNALNNQGRDYADLAVDGVAGVGTRAALSAFLRKRAAPGEMVLLKALKSLRAERYIALCEARQANEAFAYGWLSRAFA